MTTLLLFLVLVVLALNLLTLRLVIVHDREERRFKRAQVDRLETLFRLVNGDHSDLMREVSSIQARLGAERMRRVEKKGDTA